MGNISTNGIISASNLFANGNQVLHTGNWSSYCAPINHTHTYLTWSNEGRSASTRTSAAYCGLVAGWWAEGSGYRSNYGTTLDVAYGYDGGSEWYNRLAFCTSGGNIDYYQGINTKEMSYIGRFLLSNNYNEYALPLTGGTLSGGLTIRSYDYNLKSTPSSTQTFNYLRYADASNLCPFFIQTSYDTSGDVATSIVTRNYDSGGNIVSAGGLQLKALKNGNGYLRLNYAMVGNSNIYGSTLPNYCLEIGRIFFKTV